MAKESQTAMVMEGKKLKLEPVDIETQITTSKKFSTIQMSIKINEDKLSEIKEKIKKEIKQEKKDLMADEFLQKKMRLNSKKVLAEGDYDQNWKSLKEKVFGDVL